ncbi:hypothetical protein [Anaerosinus massiliensis]|uniref:hypothetical protein n=1 Tax=Massilibacillus massiliensis TaxID=1806837 RepID=UPI000DA61336|nr:hypothetical protein [Massilibacillus massiliensis]
MTNEEFEALKKQLLPQIVEGQTRPNEMIAIDLEYAADFPQLIENDPVDAATFNLMLVRLLSNDNWLKNNNLDKSQYRQPETQYQNGAIVSDPNLPSWAQLECIEAGITSNEKLGITIVAIGQQITDGSCKWTIRHKGEMHNVGDIWLYDGEFNADGFPIHKITGLAMLDCHICDGTNGTRNLINQFIMGANAGSIGSTGGTNSVSLSVDHMPNHAHTASAWTDAQGAHTHTTNVWNGSTGGGKKGYSFGKTGDYSPGQYVNGNLWINTPSTNSVGAHGYNVGVSVAANGGGQAFDNRPAYVGLAYIKKIY